MLVLMKSNNRVSVQNEPLTSGGEPPPAVARCSLTGRKKIPALQDIVSRASAMARTDMSMVTILDTETQWFVARVGIEADHTPRNQSFCHYAVLQPGEPMIVPDARRDPRFSHNPLVLAAPGIRFYAGVPLVDSSGYALGALCVADSEPRSEFPQISGLVELARRAERVICA